MKYNQEFLQFLYILENNNSNAVINVRSSFWRAYPHLCGRIKYGSRDGRWFFYVDGEEDSYYASVSSGGLACGRQRMFTDSQALEIKALHDAGLTVTQIARLHSCSRKTIYNYLGK